MKALLTPYAERLREWLPAAKFQLAPAGLDALVQWTRAGKTVTYAIEHKRHLPTLDVRLVAEQLDKMLRTVKARSPRGLVVAPYIRMEQAEVLRERGIDYLDLVGNAHLEGPGMFVHVEGKRPDKAQVTAPARPTKGWVKTVMALLIKPELLKGPYRPLTEAADVALGTVTACLKDLERRGLLNTRGERHFTNLTELIALWVQAYGEVLRPKLRVRQFQMREDDAKTRWQHLHRTLLQHAVPWALTGADGAAVQHKFLVVRETELYADPHRFENRGLLKDLVAQPATYQGNVRVIEPPGPLALRPPTIDGQPPTAPPLLLYAELRLRGGEQAHEAAEMLLPQLTA
jgi:hypothetical protein